MDGDKAASKRRWPLRWILRFGFLFLVLGTIAAGFPWLVATTSLKQLIVPTFFPEFSGKSHIGKAQLGWLSPIVLDDVSFSDQQGRLVHSDQVSSDRTLLELLLNGISGSTFRVKKPTVDLVMNENGSNWETAFESIMDRRSASNEASAVTVMVEDGEIRLYRGQRILTGSITDWQSKIEYQPAAEVPLVIDAAAIVTGDEMDKAGTISAALKMWPGHVDGELAIQAQSVSTTALAPLLGRLIPECTIQAASYCDAVVAWDSGKVKIVGDFGAKDLVASSSEWLGKDVLALGHLEADVDLAVDDDKVQVKSCKLKSDMGQLSVAGELSLGSTHRLMFGQQDYHAEGNIDLAKLVGQLPGLLRIRDEAEVKSGQVEFLLDSTLKDGRRVWEGVVGASQIEAFSAGRSIRWERPLSIQFSASESQEGKVSGRLECESDYLKIILDGEATKVTLSAMGDLTRLADDLRPLVNLDDINLAGKFNAQLAASQDSAGEFSCDANMLLEQFKFSIPGQSSMHHDRMTILLQATGVLNKEKLSKLKSGMVKMTAADEEFTVSLRGPVVPAAGSSWPVKISASGKMQSWQSYLKHWLPANPGKFEGLFSLIATGTWGPSEVNLSDGSLKATSFRFTTNDGRVFEQPTFQIASSGQWNRATGQVSSPRTSLVTPAVALIAEGLAMQRETNSGLGRTNLSGSFDVRGDVATIAKWLAPVGYRPIYLMRGKLDGHVQLDCQGSSTSALCDLVVEDYQILERMKTKNNVQSNNQNSIQDNWWKKVPRLVPLDKPQQQEREQNVQWKPVWAEDRLAIHGQAAYSSATDRLEMESFRVQSRALKINSAKGSFKDLSSLPFAEVSGQMEYDLKMICGLLKPYLGDEISFVGSGRDVFHYRGRLPIGSGERSLSTSPWWEDVKTEVAFNWDSFDVFGLKGGAADVEAKFENGLIEFQPLVVAFNGGQLKTTPQVRLESDPLLLWSKDTEVQEAELSEDLCRSWLQYVAPMLSQATRTQGKFSVKLPEGEVPITRPADSKLSGTLVIHSAQIRPGPLTAQLVAVAMQVDSIVKRKPELASRSTVLNIYQQDVAFSMADGRVYHRGFEVMIGDVVVRTSGSVGLDNSLQLVAEIPIRDKWVEGDKYLRKLKGQSLQIPIRGTLSKPKLDNRVVTELGKQMLGSAAEGLLEDALKKGLQKGLDKLFQ